MPRRQREETSSSSDDEEEVVAKKPAAKKSAAAATTKSKAAANIAAPANSAQPKKALGKNFNSEVIQIFGVMAAYETRARKRVARQGVPRRRHRAHDLRRGRQVHRQRRRRRGPEGLRQGHGRQDRRVHRHGHDRAPGEAQGGGWRAARVAARRDDRVGRRQVGRQGSRRRRRRHCKAGQPEGEAAPRGDGQEDRQGARGARVEVHNRAASRTCCGSTTSRAPAPRTSSSTARRTRPCSAACRGARCAVAESYASTSRRTPTCAPASWTTTSSSRATSRSST